jgi:mitochondrial cardiolipin hydrolase
MMNRSYWLLLTAMCMLLLGVAACGGGGDDEVGPPTLLNPEDTVPDVQVQVVDHRFRTAQLSDDNLDVDPIFNLIASANSSLDIAMTRIDRQEVVTALLNEAKSGTNIRIVTEKAYYDAPNYKPFYDALEDPQANGGNIEIKTDLEGSPRLMNDRFMIIDQTRVVTGSYNWESRWADRTFGDVISILNTNVAAAFTSQFNQMFVEGNFGVNKRDDSNHVFLVGGGNGVLEVYFGPTDRPRDLLETEITNSQTVVAAIQQFDDTQLASTMLSWLQAVDGNMFILDNDIDALGDQDENAVYHAFTDYVQNGGGSGKLYINTPIDESGAFLDYNTMNHKLLFADNAAAGGNPTIVFTTANWSDIAFTQNDETMVIMRGNPLVSKYWRQANLTRSLPSANVHKPGDFQEIDQLFCMFPYISSADAPLFRDFNEVPCALIYGTVDNFRNPLTIQQNDGSFVDVSIDLTFEIEGQYYFSEAGFGPLTPTVDGDMFVQQAALNPNHEFQLVVPAGHITVRTIVTADGSEGGLNFQPDETTFWIGPGAVRKVSLKVNQATDSTTTGQ